RFLYAPCSYTTVFLLISSLFNAHRHLRSFPTRRSSDLAEGATYLFYSGQNRVLVLPEKICSAVPVHSIYMWRVQSLPGVFSECVGTGSNCAISGVGKSVLNRPSHLQHSQMFHEHSIEKYLYLPFVLFRYFFSMLRVRAGRYPGHRA